MFVRLKDGVKVWEGDELPNRILDRPDVRNYPLRDDLHVLDGFYPASLVTVPAGYVLQNETWTVENGVAVQDGDLLTDAEAAEFAANAAALAIDPVVAEKYAAFHSQCAAAIGAAMAAGATVPEKISYETLNAMLDVLCENPATASLQDWLRMSVRIGNSWSALVVADGGNSAMTYERMPILERRRLMDAV